MYCQICDYQIFSQFSPILGYIELLTFVLLLFFLTLFHCFAFLLLHCLAKLRKSMYITLDFFLQVLQERTSDVLVDIETILSCLTRSFICKFLKEQHRTTRRNLPTIRACIDNVIIFLNCWPPPCSSVVQGLGTWRSHSGGQNCRQMATSFLVLSSSFCTICRIINHRYRDSQVCSV